MMLCSASMSMCVCMNVSHISVRDWESWYYVTVVVTRNNSLKITRNRKKKHDSESNSLT
jgi:hypothetical protein